MRKKKPSTGKNTPTLQKQQSKLIKSIKDIVKRGQARGFMFFNDKVSDSLQIDADMEPLTIPKPVKNPTKVAIARLERIKNELYDNAIWIDPYYSPSNPEYQKGSDNYSHPAHSSGIFTGKEGRAIERSRSSKKGWAKRKGQLDNDDFQTPFNPEPPTRVPVWFPIFDQIDEYLTRLETIRGSGAPTVQEERERHGHNLRSFFRRKLDEVEVDESEHLYANHLQSNASRISGCVDDMLSDSQGARFDTNVTLMISIINQSPLSGDQSDQLEDYLHGVYDLDDE